MRQFSAMKTLLTGTGLFGCYLLAAGCSASPEGLQPESGTGRPIPVIFDTDIGTDIDDTWALALLLASPELELELVVTDSGDTETRARIAAKYLEGCGRSDVPVGIGPAGADIPIFQEAWVQGYSLDSYPGRVYRDGVQALIDVVQASSEGILLLAVGPVPNLQEALRREPSIARKVRVIAMSGSVRKGYDGKSTPDPEYNVKQNPAAAAAMYSAGWDLLIAPLDTAGSVRLDGPRYASLRASTLPRVRLLLENYRIWAERVTWGRFDPDVHSSTLFDALAVALAFRPEFCRIEPVRLKVTDDGYTRRSADGLPVRAALEWSQSAETFADFLTERLLARD